MEWKDAPDVKREAKRLITDLKLDHIKFPSLFFFRSYGSKSRARARIWSMPKVWQQALMIKPCYIIEVLSERFDRLDNNEKQKTIIHELMHIPMNFSGSLLPHRTKWGNINKKVFLLFNRLKI